MVRTLYTLLWWIALPFLPLRLWWRGRREPGYRERVGERFGVYAGAPAAGLRDVIWIHAVSLGETRAAAPLIERIARERPSATILLTHMTATGREAGRTLFGDRVVQAWLPYDVPFAIRAFLARFRPRIGLLMETELWPNLAALLPGGRRAAAARQRPAVGALGGRLRAHPRACAADDGVARGRRRANRRRRRASARRSAHRTSSSSAT